MRVRGATAEEIAVFKAKDEKAADRIYQAMQKRVEEQKTAFENYQPAEMKKLQDPLIKSRALWLFSVSDDTPAAEKSRQGGARINRRRRRRCGRETGGHHGFHL